MASKGMPIKFSDGLWFKYMNPPELGLGKQDISQRIGVVLDALMKAVNTCKIGEDRLFYVQLQLRPGSTAEWFRAKADLGFLTQSLYLSLPDEH